MAQVFEDSDLQVKSFTDGHEVNVVGTSKRSVNQGTYPRKGKTEVACYRCGRTGHISRDSECAARGKTCRRCRAVGHFEKVCKTKFGRKPRRGKPNRYDTVKQVSQDKDEESCVDDTNYAFVVNEVEVHDGRIQVEVGNVNIPMLIDSGSSCNIVGLSTWRDMKAQDIICDSKKETKPVFPYGVDTALPVAGTFKADIKAGEMTLTEVEFIVVKRDGPSLLGRKTSQKLGVLKLGNSVNSLHTTIDFVKAFPECFEGFGKLKDYQLNIPIDSSVQPVIQNLRSVPYHLRERLSQKLEELEKLDIIEKVDEPSKWVSPIVIVLKPGKDIRVCVDMRVANQAVMRVRNPMPTIDDVLHDLSKSTVFSKLDIKWAYHQIELAPESRHITTFCTHQGLYRYKRLMFGISCAPELYQKILQQILQRCEGVRNIMDGIIVHASSVEEHDKRMTHVLQVLRNKGLTLNPDKCQFRKENLQFLGHVLSETELSPAEAKVAAVKEARTPTTAQEVRSFLGLVNFNGRFIENMAIISEPLRKLTRKNNVFVWGSEQKTAFEKIKKRLTSTSVLAYFDKEAPTQVITDASPVGLGAVLVQQQNGVHRVICYASKSLTDVEKRYSQTEKEALALVWACERFHAYLYGAHFEILTDHKPLQFIHAIRSRPCPRIERWVLRMQAYEYSVKYIKGENNIADCLSRLLRSNQQTAMTKNSSEADEYVRFVASESTPAALTTSDVENAPESDSELKVIRDCLLSGRWHMMTNVKYVPVRHELSAIGKIVLRGTRLVIPMCLRDKVLCLAHEGHPGVVKMKQRLRTKVWWPGIDAQAEAHCKSCHGCQVVSSPNPPPPLFRTTLPSLPWQHLAADLLGPLPSGKNILVVVDYYSRFFELYILKKISTDAIIGCLKKAFLTHGLPYTLKTDNGPQFIEDFMKQEGIIHNTSTPYWPQENGEVERQNKTLLKTLRISQVEEKNWKQELQHFLMMYRSTPHSSTGKAPAEMLFGRKIRTKLPELVDFGIDDDDVRDFDSVQKMKGKDYADLKRCAQHTPIQTGDKVLVRQHRENKLSSNFHPQHCTVVNRYGNAVDFRYGNAVDLESSTGGMYRRHVTHVKNMCQNQVVM